MDDIKIRKAQPDDLPTLQNIARRTIDKSYRSFLGDERVESYINSGEFDKEIQKRIDDCDVLLKENSIVAFAVYFGDFIDLIMVDISLHRTGIGSKLLAHTEKQLFSHKNSTIRLETCEGNLQAINFYKRNGWYVTGKKEDKEHGFIRMYLEKKAL